MNFNYRSSPSSVLAARAASGAPSTCNCFSLLKPQFLSHGPSPSSSPFIVNNSNNTSNLLQKWMMIVTITGNRENTSFSLTETTITVIKGLKPLLGDRLLKAREGKHKRENMIESVMIQLGQRYIRILMNVVAFARCFEDKKLFSILYFISFVCDGLDGWFARKFNQVSTFGAVLDMVTDRVSTACLLVILSQLYRPGLIFLSLLALDIASHWLQMYSTFLSGKASHKDVKDSTNWLFKAYYGNRLFMAYCCVASEVLYIILFLLAENQSESVINVLRNSAEQNLLLACPVALALFGWAIKQAINVIQMKTAADVCVLYDMNKRQRP
ncbi:hypothetical protein GIB67_043004 [Kingdonia uniflora]|uniref:CDP-diacylglycerol--inositol 3-phosphatidyltransferase n=1 Tax=Kingdonia uniflora TaxID=39325 RepID=A0A7J7NTK5_9MAGN|nr:hypothetical protein GIB67_043004 [Kingdonia uniflora]